MGETDAVLRQMERVSVIRPAVTNGVAHPLEERWIELSGETSDSAHCAFYPHAPSRAVGVG